jgi:glutamyl-tRNA synthetase
LYRERVKTLKELADEMMYVDNGIFAYDQEEKDRLIESGALEVLDALIDLCKKYSADDFIHDDNFDHFMSGTKNIAQLLQTKVVFVYQLIRLALIGKPSGPGVFDLLILIGKEKSIARLCILRDILNNRS